MVHRQFIMFFNTIPNMMFVAEKTQTTWPKFFGPKYRMFLVIFHIIYPILSPFGLMKIIDRNILGMYMIWVVVGI